MTEPTPELRELFVRLYDAFNARRIDDVLTFMHPEVEWPNGMQGGYIRGPEAVREYWTMQWGIIDPNVEPLSFAVEDDGRSASEVHQTVRDLKGTLLADRQVGHVYRMRDGLVDHMEIRG